ncbi:hypothetical protein AgCh_014617 [Apium graveolens]
MDHKVLGIFDSNKQHQNTIRSLQGQSRHAIYNGINEYLKLLGPNSDAYKFLRSLAITNRIVRPEVEVKMMYTRFKYLKVLDLSSAKNSYIIPEEIGDLILLKFLCLMGGSYGKVFVIPPSVGKLKRKGFLDLVVKGDHLAVEGDHLAVSSNRYENDDDIDERGL